MRKIGFHLCVWLGLLLAPFWGAHAASPKAYSVAGTTWMLYRGNSGFGDIKPEDSPYFFTFNNDGTAWMYIGPRERQVAWHGTVSWAQDSDTISFGYEDKSGRTEFVGNISLDGTYMRGKINFLSNQVNRYAEHGNEERWQAWKQ